MINFENYLTELSIGRAAAFAGELHKGQHRKGTGAPYIIHPTAVYKLLKKFGIKDRSLLVAAFLHDTLEDTPISYNELKKEFGKYVADLVKEVTSIKKDLEKLGKEDYLIDKMNKMSDPALIIKLTDRLHNLQDITAMPGMSIEKLKSNTKYIINKLKEKRKLNSIHRKIIRAIKKEIKK